MRYGKLRGLTGLVLGCLLGSHALQANAQEMEVQLLGLGRNGTLSWTNTLPGGTCTLEWAPTVDGPWSSSWEDLTNLPVTNSVMTLSVPMFFRVVSTLPPAFLTHVIATVALNMILERQDDLGFSILDVRTPSEYAVRHIRGALNLDFRSASFASQVAQLDRTKAYLVYCASGSRSGQAAVVMRDLGFRELYNLLGGLGGFTGEPGADAVLEP